MSLFGSSRREGCLAVLILLLLSVAVHAPGLFFGQPRGAALRDNEFHDVERHKNRMQFVPAMQAAGRTWHQGELPLWNRDARLGESFLTSGAAPFYPPFWLLMHPQGDRWVDWLLCLHTFLAAFCMYHFLRRLPLSRYVSFVCGGLYGLGWTMTVQLDRLPEAAVAALMPLALAVTWRLCTASTPFRRRLQPLLVALTIGALFATGAGATACLALVPCLLLFAFGMFALDSEDRRLALRGLAATVVYTALLLAPLWLHALEHHEPAASEPTAWQLGMTPKPEDPGQIETVGLLGLLSPDLFGGATSDAPAQLLDTNPDKDPTALALYPGMFVIFMVVLGLMRPRRRSHGLLWILVGGAGLLLTLQKPLGDFLLSLPAWNSMPPGAGLLLTNLALVILAALALENYFEAPMRRRLATPLCCLLSLGFAATAATILLVPSLSAKLTARLVDGSSTKATLSHLQGAFVLPLLILAAIAVLFLVWRRLGVLRFKAVLAVIALADVMLAGLLLTPRIENGQVENARVAHTAIPTDRGRVVSLRGGSAMPVADLARKGVPLLCTQGNGILGRTASLLNDIDGAWLRQRHRTEVSPLLSLRALTDPLLEIAGCGVAVSPRPFDIPGFSALQAPSAPLTETKIANTPHHVFVRDEPPVRARVLFQVADAKSPTEALVQLREHRDHLNETVVLEERDTSFRTKRPGSDPKVEILDDGSNRVRLRVDMGQGRGYLLLADAFAPGWEATVDGERTKILPADLAMRAIAVPEGRHEIEFAYRPLWWSVGGVLSLAGLALALLVLVFGPFAGRRREPVATPSHD